MKTMTTPAVVRARDTRHLTPTTAEAEALARAFTTSPAWRREQLSCWFPQDTPTTLCRRLTRLVGRGILARVRLSASRGSGQYVYLMSRAGSQLLLGPAIAPPRGVLGRDLYHSLGISAFYLQLQTALRSIDGELLQWWGQAASLCYLDGHRGPYINPDAAFLIGHHVEQLCLFEYDRAPNSASATQFLNKLERYLRYYERRAYQHHLGQGSLKPLLLCLFADQARMERIQDRAGTVFESRLSSRPTILFGSEQAGQTPLSRIWVELASGGVISPLDRSLR